jgi:hypothetical protein
MALFIDSNIFKEKSPIQEAIKMVSGLHSQSSTLIENFAAGIGSAQIRQSGTGDKVETRKQRAGFNTGQEFGR